MADFSNKLTLNNLETSDDPRFRITPVQQMVAACTGGILTSLLMTPLDVVKVRLQAQQKNSNVLRKSYLYCNGLMDHFCPCFTTDTYWYSKPIHFSGTLDAFFKISRHEGVSSLWSGLSPTLVLALPATIIYFVTYEQLRSRLKNLANKDKLHLKGNDLVKNPLHQPSWVPLIAGCTARTWSVITVSPLELIRTKMQSERLNYFQMHEAVKSLIRYHGFRGLWKGATPTLMRDVPFSGIYWVSYEKIKSFWNQDGSVFLYSFLGGSISGAIAAIITNPFDVVKTLYQIELIDKQIMTEPPGRSATVLQTLKKIQASNGVSGLFSGLIPRLIKIVPACAIMVATFEFGKSYFHQQNLNMYLKTNDEKNC